MKTILIFLLISFCFSNCSEEKQAIDFATLPETEFNAAPFRLPAGVSDSLKHSHDSCMGFSFDVNALFIQTRDMFSIGSIVNRRSLKVVNTIGDLGLSEAQMASQFNVLTNLNVSLSNAQKP